MMGLTYVHVDLRLEFQLRKSVTIGSLPDQADNCPAMKNTAAIEEDRLLNSVERNQDHVLRQLFAPTVKLSPTTGHDLELPNKGP